MAKKITDNTPIQDFYEHWGGTYQSGADAGKEWGKSHEVVEQAIKDKVSEIEGDISDIEGDISNIEGDISDIEDDIDALQDAVVTVDQSLSTESPNPVQNRAVATEINAVKARPFYQVTTTPIAESNEIELGFVTEEGNEFTSVRIPAASDMGRMTYPKVTTTLRTPIRIKLGDSVVIDWEYDHILQEDGATSSTGTPALRITIRAQIGSTVVYTSTIPNVAAGHSETLTLTSDVLNQAGTLNVYIIAEVVDGEELQRAQGFKSISIVSMSLATTFDPASMLSANGYTDGQTITIPYSYTVPAATNLLVYLDGESTAYTTATISGTARGNLQIQGSLLSQGRHNIQMIAESAGLVSNAISIDLLKSGSTATYLGMRIYNEVSGLAVMPQAHAYGSSAYPLTAEQFGFVTLDIAVWQSGSIDSTVIIAVDGTTTQTLTVDRTLHEISQRFDESGNHTMTITVGSTTRTFSVSVLAAAGVSETETSGYRNKLTANGRTNNESESTRADWGGITTMTGVDFRSNGWNTESSVTGGNVTSLLLTNGATASIDIRPFVLDLNDNNYSIQNNGMTLEMEIKFSQVMERGVTLVSCLYDNDNNGWPMGIKITTEEAGLYFGGLEQITTAEDLVDDNGNYIDYEGNIVDKDHKVPLKVTRPRGITMNIAPDKWLHLSFVIQPTTNGVGLAMLYINGVLSRANRYTGALRQTVPQLLFFDSARADLRIKGLRYYRSDLKSDEVLSNWIIDRPTAALIQAAHNNNAVGDENNTADMDGNLAVSRDTLISRGRGVMTIIRSQDRGNGLDDLFACVDKKENFKADLVKWSPPLDGEGNQIGDGFEARNVRVRIQGTSSVKYPYKNIRIYLTTEQNGTRSLVIGGEDVTETATGYALRGDSKSIPQAVLCLKTDFVDSSLVLNTGGAHLFHDVMKTLNLTTPPQDHDNRVRQAIDGIPCDIFSGTSENGALTYCGQFVLNNEKSKSSKIFGMEGVKDANGNEVGFGGTCAQFSVNGTNKWHFAYKSGDLYIRLWNSQQGQWGNAILCVGEASGQTQCEFAVSSQQAASQGSAPSDISTWNDTPQSATASRPFLWLKMTDNGRVTYYHITGTLTIALEALTNSSPMTLFQPAGSENSQALADQLDAEFGDGFEFNHPEDALWENVDEGQWDADKGKWAVKPLPGARQAIKKWLGWIYDCVPSAMRSNPDYGTQSGWSDESKAKWVSTKFKNEASQHFSINHLLTYYLFTDYWASVDQRAKNILWRTWDGTKWYATYYDGDTAQSIRNDAFMVYLYNITRDSYDSERAKYAFEGHNSWLWCLVLANFEDELKDCAAALRAQLTTQNMLSEFNGVMMGNWSERQYNKSGKLKYIDTVDTMNYVYTLTGNREAHRTAFLTDRARLLDARYGAGEYAGDVITFTIVRNSGDNYSSLTLKSGDLYYYGYKLNNRWLEGPKRAEYNELVTLTFRQTLATNDPLMLGGASKIKELDLTNTGSQLNGNLGLQLCAMMEKLIMPATNGVANAPTYFGNTSKLLYIDITGQTSVHTGTVGTYDVSKHTRLETFLAGGTSLARVVLPEGAPITTLVLPATLTDLTLRYLPNLTESGLTLQDPTSVRWLNFSNCPLIDWRNLITACINITHIRIEGMSGKIYSSLIRPFMNGYDAESANPTANMTYHGIADNGNETTYPQLRGEVEFYDVVEDFDVVRDFFMLCGLVVNQPQYSHYWFADEETDPANITNEDNKTGLHYFDEETQLPTWWDGTEEQFLASVGWEGTLEAYLAKHPNCYVASGHVKLMHDRCQPVLGRKNAQTGKMILTKLSKSNYAKLADGVTDADITSGDAGDVFVYIPRYWYKGVNEYKKARKHLFIASTEKCPEPSYTPVTGIIRTTLAELATEGNDYEGLKFANYAANTDFFLDGNGNLLPNSVVDADHLDSGASGYAVYRINVRGMKQIRFPSVISDFYCCVFTDGDGVVLDWGCLSMDNPSANPRDFIAADGDGNYDFRTIPEGAKYCWFTCNNSVPSTTAVIAVDSDELEAIEPDWVEHKPELVGVYYGWFQTSNNVPVAGTRSLSNKTNVWGNNGGSSQWSYNADGTLVMELPTGRIYGTHEDAINLTMYRGEGYSSMMYETEKNMNNLFMAYFGTRNPMGIVGKRDGFGTTGSNNSIGFGDSTNAGKMWGVEGWIAYNQVLVALDGVCTRYASYEAYIRAKRANVSGAVTPSSLTCFAVRQDGTISKILNCNFSNYNNDMQWHQGYVARVKYGRYCDTLPSRCVATKTWIYNYASGSSAGNGGASFVRGARQENAGIVNYFAAQPRSLGTTAAAVPRLCYQGEFENESAVNDQLIIE